MVSVTAFVGLDYHQSGVQVCVMDRSGKILMNRKCVDDWRIIRSAVAKFGDEFAAGIEACNGAANLADQLVDKANWSVSLGISEIPTWAVSNVKLARIEEWDFCISSCDKLDTSFFFIEG